MFMRAYFDLASTRGEGGRLPWTAVDAWCSRMGLTGEDARDVHFLITRMDLAYLKWAKDKKPGDKSGNT